MRQVVNVIIKTLLISVNFGAKISVSSLLVLWSSMNGIAKPHDSHFCSTQNISKMIPHKMIHFTLKGTHYPISLIFLDQIPNFFTLPIALILIAFSYNCIVIVVMFYLFYSSHMLNILQFVCHCQAENPGSSIVCRFSSSF